MVLNVATPATAATVLVPLIVAPPGFAPNVSVTLPPYVVAVWLSAFIAVTTNVVMAVPAVVVTG